MKAKISIDFDTESGDYEIQFNNKSNPGEGIEFSLLKKIIQRVLDSFSNSITLKGPTKNNNSIKGNN